MSDDTQSASRLVRSPHSGLMHFYSDEHVDREKHQTLHIKQDIYVGGALPAIELSFYHECSNINARGTMYTPYLQSTE